MGISIITSAGGGGGGTDYLAEHADALTLVWGMTETSGDIIDLTGNGYDATVSGSPTRGQTGPDGVTANAIQLNTLVSDNINIAAGFGKGLTDNWALNLWLRMPSELGVTTILSWGSVTSKAIAMSYDAGNRLEYYERGTGGIYLHFDSPVDPVLEDDTWHMLTMVYDNAKKSMVVYVDRLPVGVAVGNTNAALIASGEGFRIGSLNGSAQGWTGLVSEMRYWKGANAVLQPAAITQLWNSGNGYFPAVS